jgi:hypothetical protein
MDNIRQTTSGAIGFSAKVPGKSISKNERWFLQMQATKFHTEPETETESGVRLNFIIRDLVINEHADNTCHPTCKEEEEKKEEIRGQNRDDRERRGKFRLVEYPGGGNRQAEVNPQVKFWCISDSFG